MKTKVPKDGPLDRLYDAAREIVDNVRSAGNKTDFDATEVRLPILMHGTDMRVTIEAGPRVAARNAVEQAQMKATGKPVEDMGDALKTLKSAQFLLRNYARSIDTSIPQIAEHKRQGLRTVSHLCKSTADGLEQLERVI